MLGADVLELIWKVRLIQVNSSTLSFVLPLSPTQADLWRRQTETDSNNRSSDPHDSLPLLRVFLPWLPENLETPTSIMQCRCWAASFSEENSYIKEQTR